MFSCFRSQTLQTMKHQALTVLLALSALALPLFPPSAEAEVEVSFSFFQNALDPYGEWIEVGDYGTCWHPSGVADGWSPYSDGYWSYTDAGWTWVSYEDWGGITYHYGRWVRVVGVGWVWVPDYEWGPAWVSWRSNADYVGWAPLPPEATWDDDTGFSTWVDSSYDIGPGCYNFCHSYDFGCPVLAPVLCPPYECVSIFQQCVNVTNICYDHTWHRPFCGGPNYWDINRRCHRPVPALKLVNGDVNRFSDRGRIPPQRLSGNQLEVFAPKVTRPANPKDLPVKPRRIVGADQVNRGWSQIKEAAVRDKIKAQLRKESNGVTPASAPARPVSAEDLAAVPKVADPKAPSPGAIARRRSQDHPPTAAAAGPILPPVGQPNRPERPSTGVDQPTSKGFTDLPRARSDGSAPRVEPSRIPAQPGAPVANAPRPERNRAPEVAPSAERPPREEGRGVQRPNITVHPPAERSAEPRNVERADRPAPVAEPRSVERPQHPAPAAEPPGATRSHPEPPARPVQPSAPSAPGRPVEKEMRRSQRESSDANERVVEIARQHQMMQRQIDVARQYQSVQRGNEIRQYQARQQPVQIERSIPHYREFQAPRQAQAAPPRVSAAPQRPVQSAPAVQRSGGGNANRQSNKSEDGSNSRRGGQ
jgi:hypothetical protein